GYGVWGASLGTGLLTALLSSIMNNMPTVLVGALSIHAAEVDGVVQQAIMPAAAQQRLFVSDVSTPLVRRSKAATALMFS
ncbi:ArsB/NhaD family transporter, partial [Klebsiella pneumoniae]|uniref:ArsB/NhaD family transporter n=1 Tax=Klebsiella pneumoniae TaxID=573 RepID=UPI00273133CC